MLQEFLGCFGSYCMLQNYQTESVLLTGRRNELFVTHPNKIGAKLREGVINSLNVMTLCLYTWSAFLEDIIAILEGIK